MSNTTKFFKKFDKYYFAWFVALMLAIYSYNGIDNDFFKARPVNVEVISKIGMVEQGHGPKQTYVVFKKLDDNTMFNMRVSLGLYLSIKPGDHLVQNIRPYDYARNDAKLWEFGVLPMLALTGTIIYIAILLIMTIFSLYNWHWERHTRKQEELNPNGGTFGVFE